MPLNNKQRSAVMALASGSTIKQASEIAGISERSLYRWLQEDEFTQAVNIGSQEKLEQASRKLLASMSEALDVILDIMRNSRSAAQRRLSANNIIELGIRLNEMTILEKRVSELERRYYERDREESR